MMDSSGSLSGETLFLRQAPLVLECPPPAWKLCSTGAQRPARPCSLNLAYTISLPVPPQLQQQSQQNPFRKALSSLAESKKEGRGNEEEKEEEEAQQLERMRACSSPAPDLSGGSSPTGFAVSKEKPTGDRGTPRWVNPFIPEEERNEEEEEEEDLEGDNLHKYQEDFSFQLHGDTKVVEESPVYLTEPNQDHGTENACTRRTMWSRERGVSKELENLTQPGVEFRPRCDSRGTPMLIDRDELQWGGSGDSSGGGGDVAKQKSAQTLGNTCLCTLSEPHKQSESFVDNVSDSSCNSSDGVLVTFSTIYSISNNAVPANPFVLESPIEPSHGTSSLSQDGSNVTPCWSPQDDDPNCNYQLDSEDIPSSPLPSDLATVLHAQSRLAVSTQNYYKLVTCDLSSQSSPSPAWSSVTSCSEGGHSQSSPTPPAEYFLFRRDDGEAGTEEAQAEQRQQEEEKQGYYGNKGANEMPCKTEIKGKASLTRSCDTTTKCLPSPVKPSLPRVPSCPGHLEANGARHHVTSFAEIAHCKRAARDTSSLRTSPEDHQYLSESQDKHGLASVKDTEYERQDVGSASNFSTVNQDNKTHFDVDPENLPSTSKMEGACSLVPGVVRFSRDQRPTSLPIQPFVLQLPPGKQQKPLGSLLNQYLSHGKSSGAHHRGKGKGKGKAVPSYLRPSPLGGYSALHLEAASSSDTCSTCTPSPVPFPHPHRMAWGFHHHHQQQRQTTPPYMDQTQSSSSSNPFRLYVSQSSPDEMPDCQMRGSEDAMSLSQTGAKQSTTEALNHICSLKPAHTLPSQQSAGELGPKMADTFQPLAPSSLGVELSQLVETAPVWDVCYRGPSPAVTSVTCLNTPPCLSSSPAERPPAQCSTSAALSTATICKPALPNRFQGRQAQHRTQPQHQQGDSFSLTDRPPDEFCLSPDASSESLSIDLLQKKALVKAVSSAVDLITTYFEHPSRDPDEKLQLGNSTLNPTIAQLVLNQLCPAIRNILLDGLRSYKLDLIVGQRRNQPWDIVLASTQPGPTTRVLHSLVSVVSKCSRLTKHSMRFNAFIMGLLNLRALEFWLNHLYTCVDVLRPLYHHWGLVPLWEGPCRPHLHELLLLLEPLATLPFDLHLLSEARLLKRSSSLLAQSAYSSLQMSAISTNPNKGDIERKEQSESTESRVKQESSSVYTALLSPQTFMQYISLGPPPNNRQSQSQNQPHNGPLGGSNGSDSAVGWWLKQPSVVEGVMAPSVDTQESRQREEKREKECDRRTEGRPELVEERTPQELRWASLFGARVGTTIRRESKQQGLSKTLKNRLPSQWLSLDGSGLELLAQSVWSSRSRQDPNPCPNHTADMGERNRH